MWRIGSIIALGEQPSLSSAHLSAAWPRLCSLHTTWLTSLPRSAPTLPCRSVGRPVEKREGDGAADFSQLLHRDGSVFSVVYPKDLEQPE